MITSYSQNPEVIAHSRILDPPVIFNYEYSPHKLRLLSRLNFYLDQLNLLSRANYLVALVNRIGDIRALREYEPLSSQPLLNRRGERFKVPSSYTVSRTLVTVEEPRFVGEVFPVNSVQYFFFGVDLEIIEKLIYQNFSDILAYRCSLPRRINITVDAKLRTQDLDLYRIDYTDLRRARDRNRVVISLSGTLHSNSAGIVWGSLD